MTRTNDLALWAAKLEVEAGTVRGQMSEIEKELIILKTNGSLLNDINVKLNDTIARVDKLETTLATLTSILEKIIEKESKSQNISRSFTRKLI